MEANQQSFGAALIPDYRFERAKVIASFGADFLGTWLSSTEYTKGYAAGRKVLDKGDEMSRHYQFESGMTLTGSNADVRVPIKPSEEKTILTALYYQLLQAKGFMTIAAPGSPVDVEGLAEDLLANEGESLVISGSNDVNIQLIVNAINNLLGNYGSTILFDRPLYTHQAIDADFEKVFTGLKNKEIAGVLCWE